MSEQNIEEERNDRAGREINAAAKVRAAGLDPATCGEEQAAAVAGPLMGAAVCRQARKAAAEGHIPD